MTPQEEIAKLDKKLTTHIKEHSDHVREQYEINVRQDAAFLKNMEAIAALTKSTQVLVDACVAVSSFRKFLKWLSGFAIVGGVIAWLSENLP